jgi:hypothetical protein
MMTPSNERRNMQRQPDVNDITVLPLLGILATANVTLDSLVGGLQDHFPEILDFPEHNTDAHETHHNARVAIELARTLQAIVTRICAHELELVDPTDGYF